MDSHNRSIDDFLGQLNQAYKPRLPHAPTRDGFWNGMVQCRHYLPLPLLSLCIANSSDATEILMLSYLLANPQFRHDMLSGNSEGVTEGDSSSMEGAEYLAASIFLGMLIGGTVLGFLSDQIGRRPALLAGLLINAIAGFSSSLPFLTPTIQQLTRWRFISGIGVGATVPSLFSLASEWSPKEVRGAVVTFVASFWMVGSILVSGLAWILFRWDDEHDIPAHNSVPLWRIFAALCAFPSGLGAWMVYLHVPESPRFLASAKQKYDLSADACNTMAASLNIELVNDAHENGGEMSDHSATNQTGARDALSSEHEMSEHSEKSQPGMTRALLEDGNSSCNTISTMHSTKPLTAEEIRQHYASSTTIDSAASSLTSNLRQTTNKLLDTLQNLYSTRMLTRTTLPLQTIWFCLSFGTYGITTWINTLFVEVHLENIYFNSFLFALANLPGNIISILYSDRWGRKRLLVWSLLGASGGLAVFALLVYWGGGGAFGIVLSACVFQMLSIVSWNAVDILSGELFPTRVRSAGMGVCTASGRFGAMSAQFVNAKLLMAGGVEGGVASASVLVVAASTLLVGAGMPLFLERDMALGELIDEIAAESPSPSTQLTLGCMGMKSQKIHLSDDETDVVPRNRSRKVNEYQAIQQRAQEVDSFCLL